MSALNRFVDWVNGDERAQWYSPAQGEAEKKAESVPAQKRKKASGHWGMTAYLRSHYSKEQRRKIFNTIYYITGVIVTVTMIVALMMVMTHLPIFGRVGNPTNNELSQYYIEHGLEDAGAVNLVGNMILSYRVFDTFGESSVLFLAAASVMMLLTRDSRNTNRKILGEYKLEDEAEEEAKDQLLRTSTHLLLPLIFTYGIYVILNGHLSPGGGFAGGSILGGGLILYAQEFGNEGVSRFFTEHLYHIIKVGALAIYGLILLYYAFTGVNSIANHIWLGIPGTILSSGIIMPINVVVGFEVACTIYAFYALFHKGEI